MRFELDDEHYDFAAVVDGALTAAKPAAVARALSEGVDSAADDLVARLAAIGVPGLTAPTAVGGSELGLRDCVLVMEQLGRHLVPDHIALGIAVVVPVVAGHAIPAVRDAILPDLAAGSLRATVQDGWSGCAPWAADVGIVAVVDGDEVHLVRPTAADVESIEGTDPTRRLGRALPSAPLVVSLGGRAASDARRRAAAAGALLLVGAAQAMVERAAAYANDRFQFGSPIGAFQGVKHQLADAYSAIEFSRRTSWWAAVCIDDGSAQANEAVSVAKATIGEAATQASYAALQVHGGIGYTWECDLHLWMKRSQALEAAWGNAASHWRRLSTLPTPAA
jgi:alkylation response protein AidB-like acyl-CoA dehydrogenase